MFAPPTAPATDPHAWRVDADARIARHRQGDFTLRLTDAAGRPLAGQTVRVRLVRHAFQFGTAIAHAPWADRTDDGARYRDFILRHFNSLVCENEMKWYAVCPDGPAEHYAPADALLAWAETQGLAMRGHCFFWARNKFVQPWVRALAPDDLRRTLAAHVASKAARYHGRVNCWDVNNELLDGAFFSARLGPDIDAWMFREAARATPGTPLFVNEFATLGHDEKTDRLLALVAALRDRGAPVGGIGIQEHGAERLIVPGDRPDEPDSLPERARREGLTAAGFNDTLDRFAATGLPLHLTELSAKTADARRRAEAFEMIYRLGFAHPAVEAIHVWGFWAKCHWLGADAALVDADWNLTAAGERLSHLLTREWITDAKLVTDADGRAAFRGFHGDYLATAAGRSLPATLSTRQPHATLSLP
jgi:GH35 family endo-1,4-beta-xylanase